MSVLDEDAECSASEKYTHDQPNSDAEDDSYDEEYEDSEEDEDEGEAEQIKGRKKRRKLESRNSFVITEAEENEEEEEEEAEGDVEGFLESTDALETEKEYQSRPELYRRARRDDLDDVESTIDYIKQRYQEQKEQEILDDLEESGALDDDVAWMAKAPEKGGPMLWLVRCKKGKERELALNLMAKYLLNRQSKNPLLIYSVICQEHLKGSVYVEAQRESHVVTAIAGIPHLLQRKLKLVSLEEMPSVLKSLKHRVPKVGDWRRVNRGLYQGDIAQVIEIEEGGSGKVTVCMIPRIDVGEWIKRYVKGEEMREEEEVTEEGGWDDEKNSGKPGDKKKKRPLRPAPKLFTAAELKEVAPEMVREELDGENQTWIYWNGQTFMNGFLYKKVKMNCLSMEEAQPTMNEILLFSAASKKTLEVFKVMEEMLSIPSKGTQKTQFVKGDNVEVIRGELISMIGKVQSTDGDRVVFVPSDTKLYGSDPLVVPAQHLRKYFKSGDRIKVLNGIHEGETGLITSVSGEVATVFSDSNQKNFKVLMKDIQETMETNLGKLGLGKYELHDLVQVNDQSVGMIVKVNSDGFNILNWHGQLKTVLLHDVGMKRNIRNATYHDSRGKLVSLGDTVRVTVGFHCGQIGTVAHMYQNVAWIRCREHKENGGIIAVKCMNMCLVSKNNTDSFYRSSFGNHVPRSSSRLISGNNNRYRVAPMRKVYVTKGIWKGYSGVVRNENKTSARIELDAGEKVVTLPLDHICSAQELEERTPSYRDQFLNPDISRKDDGSQTPMRMATPRHSATSYCQSDPWNPNMKPTLPPQFGMMEGIGNPVTTPFTPGAAGIDTSLKPPSSNNYTSSSHIPPPITPFTPFAHVTTPCTPGTTLLSSENAHNSDQATIPQSHEPSLKSYPLAPLTPSVSTEPLKEDEGPYDWICPDIEVLINSESYTDTHGIVKVIGDETCQVQLLPPSDAQEENQSQPSIVSVWKGYLSLAPPSKKDQIIIIKGPLKGTVGKLVGINREDALISQHLNSFVSQLSELAVYHGVQS